MHGPAELSLALSQRVLTAEFCEGCKVNDVEAIRSMGLAVQDVSAACTGRGRAVPATPTPEGMPV